MATGTTKNKHEDAVLRLQETSTISKGAPQAGHQQNKTSGWLVWGWSTGNANRSDHDITVNASDHGQRATGTSDEIRNPPARDQTQIIASATVVPAKDEEASEVKVSSTGIQAAKAQTMPQPKTKDGAADTPPIPQSATTSMDVETSHAWEPNTTTISKSKPIAAAIVSWFGVSAAQSPPPTENSNSTESTIPQSHTTNSKSSQIMPSSSSHSQESNSFRKGRSLEKEEEFLLAMRERRKPNDNEGDDEDHNSLAWYEEDLIQRRSDLNQDEEYAMELLQRKRKLGLSKMTFEEVQDLRLLADDRRQAIQEEEELANILIRKEKGELYDEDRLYHLELLVRRRENFGHSLSEEDEFHLDLLQEKWLEVVADQDELQTLLGRQNQGETVDEGRIYNLGLLQRKRRGERLTITEAKDLDLFERERLDAKLDIEEYEELLQMKADGIQVDEGRLYVLELAAKRRLNEALADDELLDLAAFDSARKEEHRNRTDLKWLLETKERFQQNDQSRFRYSEILDTLRQRINHGQQPIEEIQHILDLFRNNQAAMRLTGSELEEFNRLEEQWRQDVLVTPGREGAGSMSADNQQGDLRVLSDSVVPVAVAHLTENEKSERGLMKSTQQTAGRSLGNATDQGNREMACFGVGDGHGLGTAERLEIQRFHSNLKAEGLPQVIKVHNSIQSDDLEGSVASLGEDSYLQDLLGQRERREEDRRQETLEQALALYQIELEKSGMDKNEQLFIMIFDEILKTNSEQAKETDREHDALIEHHLKLKQREDGKKKDPLLQHPSASNNPTITRKRMLVDTKTLHKAEVGEFDATEDVSLERTRQEQLDLDELNDLYDRQERGEAIDEDRLYELELLDRYRQGEVLSEEERGNVEFFMNQRALYARFKVEFDDLILKQNAGEMIDEDRLYLLDLADRKRRGEVLSSDEIEDLDVFLVYEEEKRETGDVLDEVVATEATCDEVISQPEGVAATEASRLIETNGLIGLENNLAVDRHDAVAVDLVASRSSLDGNMSGMRDPDLTVTPSEPLDEAHLNAVVTDGSRDAIEDVSLERTRQEQLDLDELNDLYDRQERGEAIDEDRLYELELLDRYRQGEVLSEEERGDVEFFMNQRALYARFKVEFDDLILNQNAGEMIDEDRLYLLDLADRKRRGEVLSSDEIEDLDVFLVYEEEKRETGDVLDEVVATEATCDEVISQPEGVAATEASRLILETKGFIGSEDNLLPVRRDRALYDSDALTDSRDGNIGIDSQNRFSRVENIPVPEALIEGRTFLVEGHSFLRNQANSSSSDPESLLENSAYLEGDGRLFNVRHELQTQPALHDGQKLDGLSLLSSCHIGNEAKDSRNRSGSDGVVDVHRALSGLTENGTVHQAGLEVELGTGINSRAQIDSAHRVHGKATFELGSSHRMGVSGSLADHDIIKSDVECTVNDGIPVSQTIIGLDATNPIDLECELVVDEESIYICKQRKRIQEGEELLRDEVIELELLERQQRGVVLSNDDVEKLKLLRHKRQTLRTSHSIHEGSMNDDSDRSFVNPEEIVLKKKRKGSKAKSQKEGVIPKPKEKRMRRKKKMVKPTSVLGSTPEEGGQQETLTLTAEQNVHSVVAQPPPVSKQELSTASVPPPPTRKGLFGGLFGKKNQRELELEEAKRRQEELIKEQLRAMQLEEELLAMEREKQLQQMLVQEAIEVKSKADVSVSSWETDTSYEESLTEPRSTDEDFDESCDQSVSIPRSSSESTASKSRVVDESSRHHIVLTQTFETGAVASHPDAHTRILDQSIEEDIASQPRSISIIAPLILTLSTETRKEVDTQHSLTLPYQVTTHIRTPAAQDLDAVSIFSDASSMDIDEKPSTKTLDDSDVDLESAPQEQTSPKSDQVEMSKAGSLAAHLLKQSREQKKREKRRQVNRHGDEISLGTAGLRSQQTEVLMTDDNRCSPTVTDFEGNSEDSSKIVRPWRDAMTGRKISSFSSRRMGNDDDVLNNKDFFEANTELFNRSIFNFNQSFAAKFGDGGAFEKADGLSVVAEDESDTSEPLQNTDNGPSEKNEDQELLDSYASVGYDAEQSFSLLGYGDIESKLPGKKDKEEQFNEAWDTIEADKAIAAQMNQRRLMRLRERGNAREEKKDEGPAEIPRLFLFEGEKVKRKWRLRKKKDKKALKKLDNTLTKEFRKAMRDVFDSESEEEYDRTFGERDGAEIGSNSPKSKGRLGNESPYDSDGRSSHSNLSDGEMSEEEFNDDYLKRLREKSMQQEVKEMLYDKKSVGGSATSDDESVASEVSRGRPMPVHADSVGSFGSVRKSASRVRRRRPRKNRSGDIMGEGIDPAEVYAQELQKKKTRKTFTVSELRKEMEEMRYGVTQASFDDAFGNVSSSKASFRAPKNPKTPLLKPKRFIPSKSPKPSGPGVNSLRALNENVRPTLARETSFATHATGNSDQGLLGGRRKDYDTRKSTFDIGGTLGNVPTIEEDDEEAFLTSHSPASKGTTGGNGRRASAANFGLAISSFASNLISPGVRGPRGELSFGSGGHSGMSPRPTSASKDEGGISGIGFGGFGGTGFQDPLPLPTIQDEDHSTKKKRMPSVARLVGKMKLSAKAFSLAGKKRQGSQDFGGMLEDDDEMEGGLLG